MRIALCVEYDGSAFHGWQTQPGGGTVQDALEASLSQIAGIPMAVDCAGRTDAGVHASGQVVHFDTEAERPLTAWSRGVNSFLPATVVRGVSAEQPMLGEDIRRESHPQDVFDDQCLFVSKK